ncbi:MAG: peptide-methionine (S)-S-oxide reductase MsrA [Deltaproteobacteria bacterium]|nr:peptide-methionine (S)-S-oxide reductase MsrA [Deltaproteobacteria bacterium]
MKNAYFAGGCFWGVEYHMFRIPGVLSVESGYMGGNVENPTYEEVCSGQTGHAETVKITYNENLTDYETLARRFFEIHDPTQIDRQGPDIGSQYRSAVFYETETEKNTLDNLIFELEANGYDVATELSNGGKFWSGENYHQNYYTKTGKTPYCHIEVKRFNVNNSGAIND